MERKHNLFFVLFYFISSLKGYAYASCNFPSGLDGTFDSTKQGSMKFNSSWYGAFTINTQSEIFTDLEFECHIHSGTKYVSRSTSFIIFSGNFYAYMCLDIYEISTNLYYYYHATKQLPQANGARVKIYPVSTVVGTTSMICDEPTPYAESYSILLKNNSLISEEKSECPVDLQGYFSYTIDGGSSTYCENDTTYMDTCTDNSTLHFYDTTCNATMLYSAEGTLHCLFYTTPSTGLYYITLYNADATVDNSDTYRYVCMVYERGTHVSYATQYPMECQNSSLMNSTFVSLPGAMLTFIHNDSCPVTILNTTPVPLTDTSVSTGSITAGVLGSITVIASILLIIVVVVRFKKKAHNEDGSKMNSKVRPSGVSLSQVQPEFKKFDNNCRPMFTPAPPRVNGDVVKNHAPSTIVDLESESDIPPSLEKDYTLPVFSDDGDATPEPTLFGSQIMSKFDDDLIVNTPPPNSTSPPDYMRRSSTAKPMRLKMGNMANSVIGPKRKFAPVKDTAV